MQVRNKGKGKGKGKPFKKGKRDPNDPNWTIPEFGKAICDSRIVIFMMADFILPTNPFRKRTPTPLQRSTLPNTTDARHLNGYIAGSSGHLTRKTGRK
jgi:hypothetical protein